MDESTDSMDIVQLAIFIYDVDETLTVTVEFLDVIPIIDNTMENHIFICLVGILETFGGKHSYTVSMATEGTPSTTKKGVLTQFKEIITEYTNGGR